MRSTTRLAGVALLAWCSVTCGLKAQTLSPPVVPAGNPITEDKIQLGKALFWDEQLSASNTVACGTCHRPSAGGADPRTPFAVHPGPDRVFGTADDSHGSFGVINSRQDGSYASSEDFGIREQVTRRMAPTVINAALSPRLLWDGAAGPRFDDPVTNQTVLEFDAALETQVTGPPISQVEMAHQGTDWTGIAVRIATARPLAVAGDIPQSLLDWIGDDDYPALFARTWGTPDVTPARIAQSIATYERILIGNQSPFDLGHLPFDTPAGRGEKLFHGSALCFACHDIEGNGDSGFFNLGLRPASEDRGRAVHTGFAIDEGRFKTPLLRNLAHRPAFFHTGTVPTLTDVIDFYDQGGGEFAPPGEPLFQLGLTPAQKADLLAFLEFGLEDPRVAAELPPFDRPTLFTESNRPARRLGSGSHGTFGIIPDLFAVDPPVLGNGGFTVGLRDAAGGRPAFLLIDNAPGDGSMAFFGAPLYIGFTPGAQVVPLGTLGGTLWGDGFASIDLPIPMAPALDGMPFYFQALVLDFGTSQGIASSAGLEATLFAPR